MKHCHPNYYGQFSCIADACTDCCCIGWEIDIDDDTLSFYQRVEGPLGDCLRDNITTEGGDAHFILGPGERCPFLNEHGLCDLIIGLGEDCLCDICADHPRWRSFLPDRIETGLGLCCEEACRIILESREPARMLCAGQDEAPEESDPFLNELLRAREALLEILQDRSRPIALRISGMLRRAAAMQDALDDEEPHFADAQPDPELSDGDCADGLTDRAAEMYLSCEPLLPERDTYIKAALSRSESAPGYAAVALQDTAFEQLAVYTIHRYLLKSWDDGDLFGRAALAAGTVWAQLHLENAFGAERRLEIARLYSKEIEYDQDNVDAVTEFFATEADALCAWFEDLCAGK